ncbi:MAG: protein translocase subunit SecF [Candidatus Promineifilaceae bacterium]|nr:protein translocase subunit SecF [Candidatus Promineifilaceae bacterium]
MFQLVQKRKLYFLVSSIIILLGLTAMVTSLFQIGLPFRLGVDFRSGTRLEVAFEEQARENEIRSVFVDAGFSSPDITSLGDPEAMTTWQVRTEFIQPDQAEALFDRLSAEVAPVDRESSSVQSVSPSVGAEVTRAAIVAVAVAAIIVLVYIMFSFRQVPNSVRYGACAVFAMLHDLMVVFGFVSLMGLLAGWEVDALFLTAALTVAGFSLQDTIVVFDRIRENSKKRPYEDFELLVNRSVLETIHRSLATQLNAMFVLVAILLFGGASIRPFIAVLFVGLLSGTYSSIFNAVPLLVSWEKGELPLISSVRA